MTRVAALLLLPALAFSDATGLVQASAGVSQPWLFVSSDPRAAALASAVAAAPEGSFDFRLNPAGLSLLMEPQAALAHNEWSTDLGMRQEQVFFARPLDEAAFGLGLNFFSFGAFENRDSQGALLDPTQDMGYAGTVALAAPYFEERLRLGISLEASQQALGGFYETFYGLGLGALYEPRRGLRMAFNVSGLGQEEDGGRAPLVIASGGSWRTWRDRLLLLGQWTRHRSGEFVVGLATEFSVLEYLNLRLGYRAGPDSAGEVDRGISAGAGFTLGAAQLDYAFVPYGSLSLAHRASLTFKFSEGILTAGRIVVEGYGLTGTARTEYEDGLAAFAKGDWPTAKLAFSRSLKIFPGFEHAADAKVKLDMAEKNLFAERSRGLSAESKARLKEHVQGARQLMEKGDLGNARKELLASLEFEPNYKEALDLLREIDRKMAVTLDGYRREALDALSQGDLLRGAGKLRACLALDSSDLEAVTRLKAIGPRLRSEAKKWHRQGISRYVDGEIEKAVELWQRALELVPEDPHRIRRDLEKARKLLELRGT